jgi:hypothetical protein
MRFDLNPNLDRDVQPMLVDDLDAAARAMAADARARGMAEAFGAGPVHYAEQITGSAELVGGLAVGQVEAAKFTSWWLERGTKWMEGRHILEQTAKQSGLRTSGGRQRSGRGRTNRATRGG